MNPLNLDGPRFLVLYVPLLVLTFIGSVALRRRRRLPGGVPLPSDMDLPPYQVALLVGRGAALEAVVASLVHSGALELHDGVPFLSKPLPKGAPPCLDGPDLENSYNSYSDSRNDSSTDGGGGGDGGGGSASRGLG